MERKQYCVYNQTSECFLSLGVRPASDFITHLKAMFWTSSGSLDEGLWTLDPTRFYAFGLLSTRDLICLDEHRTVINVFEASRMVCAETTGTVIASILSLPLNTIYSSQTRAGDQLVICAAEEMEFRLRSRPGAHLQGETIPHFVNEGCLGSESSSLRLGQRSERRVSRRSRWPRLIASNPERGRVAVHGVKDISKNGLYLVTEDRWPLGSDVIMTLRRTDELNKGSNVPINVKLRVSRWGADGVGLSFVQSDMEEWNLEALILH